MFWAVPVPPPIRLLMSELSAIPPTILMAGPARAARAGKALEDFKPNALHQACLMLYEVFTYLSFNCGSPTPPADLSETVWLFPPSALSTDLLFLPLLPLLLLTSPLRFKHVPPSWPPTLQS